MDDYKSYCEASYSIPKSKEGMNIRKIFIFHRHGDRSALDIEGTDWDTKMCKECKVVGNKIDDCSKVKCKAGLLTTKGYRQMKDLGNYIRSHYPLDLLAKMYARATEIQRTQTSIHGVLKGIFPNDSVVDIDIKKISKDRLMIPMNCPLIKSRITNNGSSSLSTHFKEDKTFDRKINDPRRRADLYLSAVCNDIKISCDTISCEDTIIKKFIDRVADQWSDQAKLLAQDEEVLGLTFGMFANDLLGYIKDDKHTAFLFSIHDKSISMLAVGFGIQNYEHPPYASAMFLELYSKDGKKFFRIIYNNEVAETTIDDNEYIPYDKFISYIKLLKKTEEDFEDACGSGMFINLEKTKAFNNGSALNDISL